MDDGTYSAAERPTSLQQPLCERNEPLGGMAGGLVFSWKQSRLYLRPMQISGDITITDTDREMAAQAIVDAWSNCKRIAYTTTGAVQDCDCDPGRIDGCKAKIEAIARWIAAARRL